MWKKSILETIGQTPLIELGSLGKHLPPTLLGKVEYFNPGNSTKDRVALKMIEIAEREGKLTPGGTIVEATSGNTGVGVALAARAKGYNCIFTLSDKQSKEKINILKALGAQVVLCPSKVPPEDERSYYSTAARIARETPNAYHLNQYENPANPQAHYEMTGPEIWQQTQGRITHLVASMGTCGTLCGTAKYLKEQNSAIEVIGVDAYGSVLKSAFETGQPDQNEQYPYLTEAVGKDYVPGNFSPEVIDRIVKVTDRDGALTARRLSREESLFVGWSCGSATAGALQIAPALPPEAIVVIILPDHGSRYLGKIYNDDWMLENGLLLPEEAEKHLAIAS